MEEFLHQLIGILSHYLKRFIHYQVVQDFFHQQYVSLQLAGSVFVVFDTECHF